MVYIITKEIRNKIATWIGVIDFVILFFFLDANSAIFYSLRIIPSVMLVIYSEEMSVYIGASSRGYISQVSDHKIVEFLGWLFLLVVSILPGVILIAKVAGFFSR